VILKRNNLPRRNVLELIFKYNEKGWLIKEIMFEWLRLVWNRRPGVLLDKQIMV
jgi:hypothetical protein